MRQNLRLVSFALVASGGLALIGGHSAAAAIVDDPVIVIAPDAPLLIAPIGSYETGIFDESAAEIVAHHPGTQRMFVVNAADATLDVLDVSDPAAPAKLFSIESTGVIAEDDSEIPAGAVANSVAVRPDGLGVIAVENNPGTDAGWAVFFAASGNGGVVLGAVRVGALPDMVTFTPDGLRVIVANEGEPNDAVTIDPEGSVSVIDVPANLSVPAQSAVRTADFNEFEVGGSLVLPDEVRIFGPTVGPNPISENLEPEYVTISSDSTTAFVTLQEANAIAVVDIATASVTGILPLGFVDRSNVPFDASNADGGINIATWPVFGMYQPDAVATLDVDGETYLVTANEGDARDYAGFSEQERIADLEASSSPTCPGVFDPAVFAEEALGRLNVTTATGLDEDSNCYTELYTFGARSFSVWTTGGDLVFDSADAFEQLVAAAIPDFFNSNHEESNLDNRSDDKGPEPEGLVIGEVDGVPYAFVGFERVGGFAVFDLSVPSSPTFVTYINNRNFAVAGKDDLAAAGDLGPEGLAFIGAADSPTGQPLLAIGNEVSGSTTIYSIIAAEVNPIPTLPTTGGGSDAIAAAGILLLMLGSVALMRGRRIAPS